MKTYSIKEVSKMNQDAREDLVTCKNLMSCLSEPNPKYFERDFRFLQSIALCEKEEFPSGVYITKWKLALQKKIDHIEQLLICNEKWISSRLGKPFRDARPKKLLRKLGLLPPV